MKIRILKDITVDVMCPEDGTNDTYDKLLRQGVSLEAHTIVPISKGFTNVWINGGEVLLDLRNDSFEVEG